MPDSSRSARALSPLVFLLALFLLNIGAPFLPVPNAAFAVVGGVVLTLLYVGAVVAFALEVARQRFSIPVALAWLGVCVVVWLSVEYGLWPMVRGVLRAARVHHAPPSLVRQLLFFAVTTTQDLAMVGGATCAGTLLARLIRHPNMIGPIGAAIALIDIWGVLFGGIVSQLMHNKATQPLAARALAAGPKVGAIGAARPEFALPIPSIGVGDFLFIALLLSVLVNLAMNWKSAARLMWLFSSAVLLCIMLLPFFPLLPGLVPIGAGAVLPNWKYFRFTREERFALLYAAIFVLLLTVALYFGFKAALPTSK